MPFGGSHIDQVAAQIADNRMCGAHIGMQLGGFSKTWDGTEILRLPSGQAIAEAYRRAYRSSAFTAMDRHIGTAMRND